MKKIIKMITSFLLILPLFVGVHTNAKAAGNKELVEYAKTLQGIPYKYGGTTPSGFDCSGFVGYVYKKYDIQLPRTAADQFYQGKVVSSAEMAPGDLVYFATTSSGPSHAGMYIGNSKFIHSASQGVEITSLDSGYFKPRFLGARRYIEPAQVKEATTLIPMKKGQIGMVTIKKKINLWQRDENKKLTAVRILQPGDKFRVYSKDNLYGGQFNLGSKLYVTNIEANIEYISGTKFNR
jgi:hypothetical protein